MKIHLNEIRSVNNMSIRELSQKSGVAKSHIQNIESGEANPTIEVMCKLAKALGVSVFDLFSCN